MDSSKLKLYLCSNTNIIRNVLESFKAHDVTIVEGKRIQFGFPDNVSGRSHCIFLDSFLTHIDYPNNIKEDFIQMIARLANVPYNNAMNIIMLFFNGKIDMDNEIREYKREDIPLIEYDKSILDGYPKIISELFLNDGIEPTVQSLFDIRYSDRYDRILIPIFQKGKLVGLFGRHNEKKVPSNISKYFPLLQYQKGKVLFPYDINSESVKKNKWCYLVESEKTTMLCYKWGIRNIFALGGNVVKEHQIELLKELGVEKIILCLDKGLDNGFIEFSAIRLKEYGFDVYYVDVEKINYLPNKECVFDLNDKEKIVDTIKKYTRRV